MHTTPRNTEIAAEVAGFPDTVGAAVVTLAVAIVSTVIVAPVVTYALNAVSSVVVVQVPEHPEVYVAATPGESVITKVTIAAPVPVADEVIETPMLYEVHGEVHAPTAWP